MNVLIAPDSFKECLSAGTAAEAIARGWHRARPDDSLDLLPLADGGEGTVAALRAATPGGRLVACEVMGPRGTAVQAAYVDLGRRGVVLEMAAASGLTLLAPKARDPRHTTTRGTGELLAHALEGGARRVIVGLGGSATNDGGAGLAVGLGYRLLDADGRPLPPGGAALARLARIDAAERHPVLEGSTIIAACDVDNPLCGPQGASHVFGPQKGATAEMVAELDAALAHFAAIVHRDLGVDVLEIPGAGAAGGLGAGLIAFAGATLEPGFSLIADICGLDARLRTADLVITGEGRIDGQTARGKTPMGVARRAQAQGKRVIAFCGALGEGHEALRTEGLAEIHCITPVGTLAADALARAEEYLADAAEALARGLGAGYAGG